MGILVNIEAIDRGGKSTQLPLVAAALHENGRRVQIMAFPDTPSRTAPNPAHFSTGVLIERFLADKLPMIDGRDGLLRIAELADLPEDIKEIILANIEEKLIQVIFSINRRERADALTAALAANDVVLVGRWLSAYTYGVANGVSRLQIKAIEGDLPRVDLSVLLEIDPATARARRNGDVYDHYESNFDLQSKVRRLYNDLVREDAEVAALEHREPAFLRLDATAAPDELCATIIAEIERRLALPPTA